MSDSEGLHSLDSPAHPDAVAAVAVCATAEWSREGVATFVSLHDARPGRAVEVRDATALAEGARLAELFGRYHAELARAGHPLVSDHLKHTGAPEVMTTLVMLSEHHLAAGLAR